MSKKEKQVASSPAESGLRNLIWYRRSKWEKFGVLVVGILVLSTAASLLARLTVFRPQRAALFHVALIAPLSGPYAAIGRSLRDGAQLYVDDVNRSGGLNGGPISLIAHDDAGDAARARALSDQVAADNRFLAVVGPSVDRGIEQAAEVFDRAQIPMIVPTGAHAFSVPRNWSFSLGYGGDDETRFLANYIRNVSGEVLTSVVVDEANFNPSAELFQKTYERFGVPIRHRWAFDTRMPGFAQRFGEIVKEIKESNDAGTLYLAMKAGEAAAFVKSLRDSGAVNKVVGPNQIGTRAFADAFGSSDYDRYANGITTSAPLLFDTADEQAQIFRTRYLTVYQSEPDWVAAYGYESLNIIGEAILGVMSKTGDASVSDKRVAIRDYLARRDRPDRSIKGLSGSTAFGADGIGAKPIQVGVYDGRHLISALTQLQPIGRDEVGNYIQAVREGRALYVNDRFMYKTNVVYSGLLIKDIRKFDKTSGTFEMDFTVWFRCRGDVQPQDVIFANAIEPIKLTTPSRAEKAGELTYLSYNVVGRFNSNFLRVSRDYGTELLGTSFRHRVLDRNNLLYVVDVLGVGLVGDKSLIDKVRDGRVLAPALGMVVNQAWISQDVVRSDGFGSLTFVGHGKPQPDFSQITVGIVTKTGAPSMRDFMPNEYLIYATIFALMGSIFAAVMDRKREGRQFFWNAQSWLLRAVCWPLLLVSLGSLILNIAFGRLEFYWIDILVLIYSSLLWLVPAALIGMAIERFVWLPLEKRTNRKVPGSIRAMTTILVYVFAAFGIIAFVFNQTLTSLLATSGVAAMVVGLAIQGNISNIFSGIVLNLERPFQVGDILRLKDGTEAEVLDITWRSIRVKSGMGLIYSIPNSVATQSEMIRVTRSSGEFYLRFETVYVATHYNPAHVTDVIKRAVSSVKSVAQTPPLSVRFGGTMLSDGVPYAAYGVSFAVSEYGQRFAVREEVWSAIWNALNNEDISMMPRSEQANSENSRRTVAS